MIELLQLLLIDAELGALQGVAVAGVQANGKIGTAWIGQLHNDRLRLLGALDVLKGRVLKDLDDEPDNED